MYIKGSLYYRNSSFKKVEDLRKKLWLDFVPRYQTPPLRIVLTAVSSTEINDFYDLNKDYASIIPEKMAFSDWDRLSKDPLYLNFHAGLSIVEIENLSKNSYTILARVTQNILILASQNKVLTESQKNYLEKLDLVFCASVTVDSNTGFVVDRFNIERGSLLSITFDLKNTSVSKTQNVNFTSTDNVGDGLGLELAVTGSAYQSGSINLLYLVTKNETKKTLAEIAQAIHDLFWGEHFQHLYTSHIALETIKFKSLPTAQSKGSSHTISTLSTGFLSSGQYTPSSKLFVFSMLAPTLRTAPKNSFTIRLPLVAAPPTASLPNTPKLINTGRAVANFLSGEIGLDEGLLTLQLMVTTNSSQARTKYAPVTYVSCAGFVTNVKNSKYADGLDVLSQKSKKPTELSGEYIQQGSLIDPGFQKPYKVVSPQKDAPVAVFDGPSDESEGSTKN